MSAQQQWLEQFTDDDYRRLSDEIKTSVSGCLYLLLCVMLFFFKVITLSSKFECCGCSALVSCKFEVECQWFTVPLLCFEALLQELDFVGKIR